MASVPRSGYAKLLVAKTVSNLGDGVTLAALPLLAAGLTRDPSTFAGVTVASRLPWLLVSLPAGTLIDRTDRRILIGVVDVLRFVLIGFLGIAALAEWTSLWILYLVSFLLGCGEVVADIGAQVLLPSLVEQTQLERANGRMFGVEIVTNQFLGPPLGSWMFSVVVAAPFLFDAATFAAAAVLVLAIPGRFSPSRGQPPPRTSMVEGLRLLWRRPLIRTLALLGSLMNALWMAGFAVFGLYALEVVGLSDAGFGLLLTASGLGYALGSFTAGRAIPRLGRARALAAATGSEIVLFVVLGAVPNAFVVGAGLALFGYAGALWDVTAVTLRQSVVPDHQFGRVNAAYRFVQWGSMPLGAFVGGLAGEILGLRTPWFLAAALLTAALAAALPHLRRAGDTVIGPAV